MKKQVTLTNLCMNLKPDAKVKGFMAYDKFLRIIFIELLRQKK